MILFRTLLFSEIEKIIQLMQEFYAIDNYPIDNACTKTLFEKFIENEHLGKAYLIIDNNDIVGYIILTFVFSFEYKGQIAFLDELFIKKSARGKGIGTQAIQFIKNQAALSNLKLIYLEVENHNEIAQKLYLSNDFETHHRKLLKHKLT